MTSTALRVYVEADVKCFHCGQLVGATRQYRKPDQAGSTFIAAGAATEVALARLSDVHCPRCGGPTYVDDFQTRYELPAVDFADEPAPRRGRPPRSQPLLQGNAA